MASDNDERTAPATSKDETLKVRAEDLDTFDKMLDDVISHESLQVLEAAKSGLIFIEPPEEEFKISTEPGTDIFGQPINKRKQYNCFCPNCNRNLAASRLAPHLEKCMGMGRVATRSHNRNKET